MTARAMTQTEFDLIMSRARGDAEIIADPAADLEAKGWETWLTTLMPFAFPAEFAWFHREFWENWWEVCLSIKRGRSVEPERLNYVLLWGRALAKSSSGVPASLMKAALSGRIYSLYLSSTLDQAASHLANIRHLITHPDSRVAEFYPYLELDPTGATTLGLKSRDAENIFVTKGGAIFRALGLESAARGLILGGRRPDDFNIDDIDDMTDSLTVSEKKLQRLTRSVLLTRDVTSSLPVTTKLLQNVILPTGVVHQIHTGAADAFARRTTIGPVNTFMELHTETYADETGAPRHRILETSVPSWSAVSIDRAQAILDLIGLAAFRAECQNEFDQLRSGYVIPNYDEDRQVITWSQFAAVFGDTRIPRHWNAYVGLDVGYTEGSGAHLSAWSFVATAAQNSPMPGTLFVYRSRVFEGTIIDEQARDVKRAMWPGERVVSWQMSHEKSGELLTLRRHHELPFEKFRHYRAEDGIAQWKSLSDPDRSRPHPFKSDDEIEGEWRLGRPRLYYIVADEQLHRAVDDDGMRTLRDQVSTWKWVTVKVTADGRTAQRPSKSADDVCDSIKGVLALFGPTAAPLTRDERIERALPPPLQQEAIAAAYQGGDPEADGLLRRRAVQIREQREIEERNSTPAFRRMFRVG